MDTKQLVRLKLDIPEDLVKVFEAEALDTGEFIEELMVKRLHTAKNWDSERPLYFDDMARQELETLFGGKLFHNPKQALDAIKTLLSIKVGGVNIAIDAQTLKGINAAKASNESEADVIKREVRRALGDYGGTW
jgi:hypothetical protein